MAHRIRPLPEFLQFKKEMEAAGETVAIYDDGTPFVHTCDPYRVSHHTKVATEHFPEKFDEGATKCLYPVIRDEELADSHKLAAVGNDASRGG